MATTGRHAGSPTGGVPRSRSRSSSELRGPPSPASWPRATLAGKCTWPGRRGGRLGAGRSFRSVPSPSRGLGDSRLRPPGGPPAPGPRAEALPSLRGGAAPRRPSACQPCLAPHAPSARRTHLAARTGRPREAGRRATRERPPPVAGPPARPRSPPPARARPEPPGRGVASTRGRGARAAAAGEAGSAASVMARAAARRGRRSLRSLRSLAFSLTFPSSVSEESGPCARV